MSVLPGICGTSTTMPTCSCLQSLIGKPMERLSTSDRYSAALQSSRGSFGHLLDLDALG
jgi:hypothetical protein